MTLSEKEAEVIVEMFNVSKSVRCHLNLNMSWDILDGTAGKYLQIKIHTNPHDESDTIGVSSSTNMFIFMDSTSGKDVQSIAKLIVTDLVHELLHLTLK